MSGEGAWPSMRWMMVTERVLVATRHLETTMRANGRRASDLTSSFRHFSFTFIHSIPSPSSPCSVSPTQPAPPSGSSPPPPSEGQRPLPLVPSVLSPSSAPLVASGGSIHRFDSRVLADHVCMAYMGSTEEGKWFFSSVYACKSTDSCALVFLVSSVIHNPQKPWPVADHPVVLRLCFRFFSLHLLPPARD